MSTLHAKADISAGLSSRSFADVDTRLLDHRPSLDLDLHMLRAVRSPKNVKLLYPEGTRSRADS